MGTTSAVSNLYCHTDAIRCKACPLMLLQPANNPSHFCQEEEDEEKQDEQLGEESFTEVWKRMEETQMLVVEILVDLSSFVNRLVLAAAANGLCRYPFV